MLICGYNYILLLQKEKQSFQLFITRKTRPGISNKESQREFARFSHLNNSSDWRRNLIASSTWLGLRDITLPPRLIWLKHRLKSGFRTEELSGGNRRWIVQVQVKKTKQNKKTEKQQNDQNEIPRKSHERPKCLIDDMLYMCQKTSCPTVWNSVFIMNNFTQINREISTHCKYF